MSMTQQVEESTHSIGMVYLSMIVATSESSSEVNLLRGMPILRNYLKFESLRNDLIKRFLKGMGIPQNFFHGHDCDMVEKLSAMIDTSVLQRHGNEIEYFCIYVVICRASCIYNVVNSPYFFYGLQFPPIELVRRLACGEEGTHSLPAGATTLESFKVQDNEENCIICLEGFNSDSDDVAVKLPCFYVCHRICILEWFVQSASCPLCGFACSHVSSEE